MLKTIKNHVIKPLIDYKIVNCKNLNNGLTEFELHVSFKNEGSK